MMVLQKRIYTAQDKSLVWIDDYNNQPTTHLTHTPIEA